MKDKKKIFYYCADVNPKTTKSLGIYKVTKEILNQIEKNFEVTLILSKDSEKYFSEFKCKKIILKSRFPYFLNKLLIFPNLAKKIAKREGIEIIFFPKGHTPIFKDKYVKYISFIHDLIPLYYLKKTNNPKYLLIVLLLINSIKKSDLIFTNSNYSKSQISKFTNKGVEVVPLGVNSKKKILSPILKDHYVFILGNKNPHKNIGKSIELLKEYNQKYKKNLKYLTSSGNLTEEELAGYYKNAKFSLFLSSIEGFGLPLIESYSYGTPVVFNNQTSLAEIGQDLPGKCDIENKQSVFDAINRILKLNNSQIEKDKKKLLDKYNWDVCGYKVTKILKGILLK